MLGAHANAVATLPREISGTSKKFPTRHVLVVDDERLVRWAIAETLGAHGCEISEAGDAESAKRAVLKSPPDLALLDLRLPDSDDLSLAMFIRSHAPQVSLVLMTAYGTPEILSQAESLGMAIVTKPFDVDALASVVDRVLPPRPA